MVVRRPVLICPGRALRAAASVPGEPPPPSGSEVGPIRDPQPLRDLCRSPHSSPPRSPHPWRSSVASSSSGDSWDPPHTRFSCELPALGGGGASPWLESPAGSVEMESEQRAEQGAEQHHCCGLLQQDLAELCTPIGIASVPTVTVRPFSVEGPLLTLQDAFLLLWFGAPQDGPSSSAPPPTPGGLCLCFHPCRFPSSRPRRPLRRGWPRPFGSHRDGWTPSRSPLSLPFSGLNSPGSLSLSSQGDAPGPASPLSPPLGSLQEIAVCFVLGARN
ncbi:uncharacterized protein LOC112530295 isoform X6 [Gallus gallus]|uniref:uncharacterized protein LOC112530295 isoform X6 n=1 Tax=Gallus gallus TaxID=9031 RepID=UPI001F02337A|nr:uncharacterized protein LOC112530295 isoform X6 [Gallus gallus]